MLRMDTDLALEIADESKAGGYDSQIDLAAHKLAEEYRKLLRAQKMVQIGTVRYIKNGGNPGLAWTVIPGLSTIHPNDGEDVFVSSA